MRRRFHTLFPVVALAAAASMLRAEFIQPVDVWVSNGEDVKDALIDGQAFDDGPVGSPASIHGPGNAWTSVGSTKAEAVFDLGKAVSLTKVYIWNYNEAETDRGMRDLQILVSPDTDLTTTNFTGIAAVSLTEGGETAQAFAVVGTNVRLVKLKCTRNWGHGFAIGLGEARFETGTVSGNVPSIVISGLKDGDPILSGKNLTLKVEASDKDGDLTKVEFFDGATKVGEDTVTPYQFVYPPMAPGTHTLRAVATDRSGKVAFSTVEVFAKDVVFGRVEQIDDQANIGTGQNQISYSDGWTLAPGNDGDPRFQHNDHYALNKGAFYEVKFVGVRIEVYGTVASHHGTAKASIDGGTEVTLNYKADQRGEQVLIWTSPKLDNKEHTLRVTVVGDGVVTADRFDVQVSEVVQVDDQADIGTGLNQIKYNGAWNLAPGNASDPRFKNNDHYTDVKGTSFEVRFVGIKIDVFATVASHHGSAIGSIDGGTEYVLNYKAAQRGEQVLIWSSPLLQNREHVLKVTVAGDGVVTADRFDIETVAAPSKDLAVIKKWSANTREFVIELENTASSRVDAGTIRLTVDGAVASVDVTSSGAATLVTHRPGTAFAPGSEHPFKLVVRDVAGNNLGTEATFAIAKTPFPIAGLGGPAGTAGAWGIRQIWRGGRADALVTAVGIAGAAAKTPFSGSLVNTNSALVNFALSTNPGNTGLFADDLPFPGEARGSAIVDFVVVARARVRVPRSGDWTIGVRADDGFALRFIGAPFHHATGVGRLDDNYPEFMIQPVNLADSNTRGVLKNLAAGDYTIEFIYWNRSGGANTEIFHAEGDFAEEGDTDTWRLLGDAGGWELVTEVIDIPMVLAKASVTGSTFSAEFESARPATGHQLLESSDLKSWKPVTGATFSALAGRGVRVTTPTIDGSGRFFRVATLP